MLSRALSLATVTLLIGCFSVRSAQAQATNLEAGKSPSQIFAQTCTACHKGPRGLLKTVGAGSLPGFLRQHYTTSPEMATLLSGFLVSNGASDARYVGNQGKDAKPEAKPGGSVEQLDRFGHRLRPAATQEAARPEPEPKQAAKPAVEGQAPAQATTETGPDGRKSAAKQRLSKRGRPGGEEPPKSDAAKPDTGKTDTGKEEPASGEAVKDDKAKGEAAKSDTAKSDTAKSETPKGDTAKVETLRETGGGETPALRSDPVPAVTPAPPASSAAISGAASPPAAAPSTPPAPPAMTASVPPPTPAPATPAGPPAPPISQ